MSNGAVVNPYEPQRSGGVRYSEMKPNNWNFHVVLEPMLEFTRDVGTHRAVVRSNYGPF